MDKLCITYNCSKSFEVAQKAVVANCRAILNGDISIATLRKLCGSLTYSFLFIIPEHFLEDKRSYTIEAICVHVLGLLNYSVHDILTSLGSICVKDSDITDRLEETLHSCLYGETLALIGANTRETYAALLLCYARIKSLSDVEDKVRNMYCDDSVSFLDMWQFYESEVYCGELAIH